MTFKKASGWLLSGEFLYNYRLAIILWFGLALVATLLSLLHHTGINNYSVFKYVFVHTIEQKNLYIPYPDQYGDVNLYGPVFSMVIAPFALLPDSIGSMLWVMFNAALLFFAIMQLPLQHKWKAAILILCSNEMMNDASWYQSNPMIAACIILGFVYTHRGKEVWALFFILLATFIKIYGAVGFAFFFFSRNKWQYIFWTIGWSLLFFVLPFLISKPAFIIQCYHDWFDALTHKAAKNIQTDIQNDYQDISVMGMIRRIFKYPSFNNMWVYVPAICLFGMQYLQFRWFNDLRYRLYLLCSVLIFTVIFSTGSESPTYIIAFPAICIWFLMQDRSAKTRAFFIFALILTSFSYSDLLTPYVRIHWVRPYSLKALPSLMVWMILVYQLITGQFRKLKPIEEMAPAKFTAL